MRLLGALIAVFMLASAAHAQPANCNAQWSRLNDLLSKVRGFDAPVPGLIRQTADGGCRTNGVKFPAGDHVQVKAASLSWSGRDLDRFASEGFPPTALTLSLNGITIVPDIGDPVYSYLQNIQARGSTFDLAIRLNWVEAEKVLQVSAIRLLMPEDDFIEFSGQIEGIDLTSTSSMQVSVGSFALTQSVLTVRSKQMFQNYVLLPLGLAVLDGAENPAARVTELKALAKDAISEAPDQILSLRSKSALDALVDDMPEPSGILKIEQSANPGIGPARFIPLALRGGTIESLDDLWQLLNGVTLAITYDKI